MVDQAEDPGEFDAVDKIVRGRPTAYKPEFADQAKKLATIGATDIEIAYFFGVEVRTIYRWKHEHENFSQALIVGKDALDDRVERSLYQRAVGYTFESEKLFKIEDKIVREPILEHVPPDPGAAMSWLKNRRRSTWADRVEHKHTHQLMSDEQIEAQYEELQRQAAIEGTLALPPRKETDR